jgi:hypothetical protein
MKWIGLLATAVIAALIGVVIWIPPARVVAVTALIMLCVGSTAALIWWRLADSMFPGASRKTGQEIRLGGKSAGTGRPGEGAQVIHGFDEPKGPGEGESGPAR